MLRSLLATPFRPPQGKPSFVLRRDKRSKNTSAFFGLWPQRNRNPRKRIHPAAGSDRSAGGRGSTGSSMPADAAEACPGVSEGPAVASGIFPSRIDFPLRRCFRLRRRSPEAICASDGLGANAMNLSIRLHALRRSLALSADKSPFLPRWGIPSFMKKEAKGIPDGAPSGMRAACLPPTRLRRREGERSYRHLKFRADVPARFTRRGG